MTSPAVKLSFTIYKLGVISNFSSKNNRFDVRVITSNFKKGYLLIIRSVMLEVLP